MLIREKLETMSFPAGEKSLVDYILIQKSAVRDMSTKQIAAAAWSSPSSLIRIAHKLGYDGWESLKKAYCDEEDYLATHFVSVDPNLPFDALDNQMAIMAKIAELKKEAVDDTMSLIHFDALSKAVRILQQSQSLEIFAVSTNAMLPQVFALEMGRIQYPVHVHSLQSELVFKAALCRPSSCAMIISYTGETKVLTDCMNLLKENGVPVIALTSIGTNSISEKADVVLNLSTREKMYSKIGNYVTNESVLTILDFLYSCFFAKKYQANLQLKVETSQRVEKDHFSTLSVIHEDGTKRNSNDVH